MANLKNVLLFVPDGVGIRNYLYSRVFKNRAANLHLYHDFDADTLKAINAELPLESQLKLPTYKEGIKEKYLRELIHLCRLKHNARNTNNSTILHLWHKKRSGIKLKIFYGLITFMSGFYSSYSRILKLEGRYQKQLRVNPFYSKVTNQIKNLEIDVLFCTHQRALKAPAIFAAAKDLGIRTYTVIYSWDNLPKARLALQADFYLVWSEHMRSELHEFYPEIKDSQIIVSGTPQFEVYNDPNAILPKQTFYNTYGLDLERKIICFSGDDQYTSPQDPDYLRDLAQGIVAAGREKDYQILFRRCPVDVSGRYQEVVNAFPNLIKEAPPLWNFNTRIWSAVYPTKADLNLLVSVAYYCDAVVNLGSTMAFDFGMFNKPCIYINYDQPNISPWSVQTIYKFQHFKSMPNQEVVLWWNSKNQIPQLLEHLDTKSLTKISEWFNIIVNNTDSSEAIYKAITA